MESRKQLARWAPRVEWVVIVVFDLILIASVIGAQVLAARLWPHASSESVSLRNVLTLAISVAAVVLAALEASNLARAAQRRKRENLRIQNAAFFRQVNARVDQMLEAMR